MNQKLENEIIAVAYGDANLWQKIKIKFFVNINEEAANLLSEYSKTAKSVQNLNVDFPEEILDNLDVQLSQTRSVKNDLLSGLSFFFNRPILSAASVVAVLLIVFAILFSGRSQNNFEYTEAQIKLADKQVKKTLALVSNVFTETQYTLEKEVLVNRVGKPLSQGVNIINSLFNGGNRNEKLN